MTRKLEKPFDTSRKKATATEFVAYLCDELQGAMDARSELTDDYGLIDLWHALYEQAPSHRKGPWPSASDLGSYIGAEKVDATRARLVKIIGKAEPLCVVEGRGMTAKNAPYVELFHEWHQQREEKLLPTLVKWWHQALVERMGVLETYEKLERITEVREKDVLIEVDPERTGENGEPVLVFDADGEPIPVVGDDGLFVEAQPGDPQARIKVRETQVIHRGPRHRVVSGKDFVWIPGHARDKSEEVIGFFKRCWRTRAQLERAVKEGRYDKDALEKLGTAGARRQTSTEDRQGISVQHTGHPATEEFELWDGQILHDFGDGLRWHLITLALDDRIVLRVKDDPVNLCRFSLLVLFPRIDALDGYSFIGDKLFTLLEEHAGLRNMIMDRSTLAANAPILRASSSNWQPQRQPWGPGRVITVTDKGEITQAQIQDVPGSLINRESMTLRAAERVSGAADIVSSGVEPQGATTATEVTASAGYSNARLEEQVTLAQDAVEGLYELRHRMLVRMLEFNGRQEVDAGVEKALDGQNLTLDGGAMTPEQIKGVWRFKPRGSIESADPVLLQRKFQQRYQDLAVLAKFNPGVAQKLQSPELTDAMLQDWADVHKPRDREAFLKPTPPPQQAGPFGAAPQPGMDIAGMLGGGGPPVAGPMGLEGTVQ